MRLIDADALRKKLDDEVPISHLFMQYNKEDVIRAVLDAPTVGGWISVEDRLPEDETEVIIFVQHKIGWYRVFGWHDEYGWHSSAEEFGDGESDFVTHWMPLPEPPEEVSGDV